MPYPTGLDGHLNSSRSRNSEPVSSESVFAYFREPPRPSATRMPSSGSINALNDARTSLHRRFTTNTLASPIGQQRGNSTDQIPPMPDLPFAFNQKLAPSEKKKAEYEFLKQKQMQRQSQMDALNSEAKREEMELHRLSTELGMSNGIGHQSEPTTPPEYHENGFPTALSRPQRFSASNLISPPGALKKSSRPQSFITSPPSERARAYDALTSASPTQSTSQNKNHSDDEGVYEEAAFGRNHRSAASLNRNSMPVTRRDMGAHKTLPETIHGLGSVDTHSFLFQDENIKPNGVNSSSTARSSLSYSQITETDDGFPVLLRGQKPNSNRYSGTALDSFSSKPQEPRHHSSGWSGSSRTIQSGLSMAAKGGNKNDSPPASSAQPGSSGDVTPPTATSNNRHSLGAFAGELTQSGRNSRLSLSSEATTTASIAALAPKLQPSFSSSDVPTVTDNSAETNGLAAQPNMDTTFDQSFHNHNVSLGRIPPSATNSNRHSRDLSQGESPQDDRKQSFQSLEKAVQSNNTSFSANGAASTYGQTSPASDLLASPASSYAGYYNGTYGVQSPVQSLNGAMGNLNLAALSQFNASGQILPSPYSNFGAGQQSGGGRASDSQARVVQQRRNYNGDEIARFANIALENLEGEIYTLCKDQHGCRFLQKKLEENDPKQIALIFNETKEHMYELMTDPFGNYLCQKLLEHTNENQQTMLIQNAGPHMVRIALNQHGTRALQKMIEYVTNDDQIDTVVINLKDQVVPMIQDLNGNHVIQKCLNRLTAENAQFVFDAVASNVVAVGTHRHGCCVIQRCIDHATAAQKSQLINAIIQCSFPLVQDPFGNYVLQYIYDQGEDSFSQGLCRTFLGNIVILSKQKFSSNVIEKCLRIADDEVKHLMIEEMLNSPDFERLADDAFGNYVVQTAWEHANLDDEDRIAESIRPLLARMRHKPHGRRFQTRIAERDKRLGLSHSGTMTPIDMSSPSSAPMLTNGYSGFSRQMSGPPTSGYRTPSQSSYGGVPLSGFVSPAMSHSMTPAPEYGSPVQRYPSGQAYQSMLNGMGFHNIPQGPGYQNNINGQLFSNAVNSPAQMSNANGPSFGSLMSNDQGFPHMANGLGSQNVGSPQSTGSNQQPFAQYQRLAQNHLGNGYAGNDFSGGGFSGAGFPENSFSGNGFFP